MRHVRGAERERLESEGAKLLRLVYGWKWIDRRVESVTFLDDVMARREVSITFTAPGTRRRANRPQLMHLPLSLMNKETVTDFDFTDEDARVVPLLPASEKSVMASGLLLALLRDVAKGMNSPCPEILVEKVRGAAECDAVGATAALEAFWNASYGSELGAVLRTGNLMKARVFRALLTRLAHNHLVIVPCRCMPGEKRVMRFSYVERVRRNFRRKGHLRLPPPPLQSLLRSIGWSAKVFWFPAPAVGQGGTYHFQISAPPGLKITQAMLIPVHSDDGRARTGQAVTAPASSRSRPHLFTRDGSLDLFSIVYVKMRARGSTVVRAAAFTAVGIAAILAIGYKQLPVILSDDFDVEAAATLLLLVPTIAAGYVINTQEHPMTTFVVFGTRLLTLAVACTSFAACGIMILGDNTPGVRRAWGGLALAAALIAVSLLVTLAATWKEDEPLRKHLQRYRRKPIAPDIAPPPG